MPWARVAANVRLPLDLAGMNRAEADRRVADTLAHVGLDGVARHYPRQLSGGMRMRVAIARGLVTGPDLLLMDEPFGALDEFTRNRLDGDLVRLWWERKLTIILVTHSIYEAVFRSTRVAATAAHPGRIFKLMRIDQEQPRDESLRNSPRFAEHCRPHVPRRRLLRGDGEEDTRNDATTRPIPVRHGGHRPADGRGDRASRLEPVCRAAQIPVFLFPKPSDIAAKLLSDGGTPMKALLATLRVTPQAFLAALVIGTMVAFLFVQSRVIEMSLFPYAVLLQVTPIVAIAPLVIILVKNTQLALTICATVIALFPVISDTTLGLRSADPGLINLFRMHGASRLQVVWRLRTPSALPHFFGGLRISSGLALIGAVVAEFVAGTGGRSAGLAYEILQSGFSLDIPRMFAALFLITAAGVGLFGLMVLLLKLVLGGWHESEIGPET